MEPGCGIHTTYERETCTVELSKTHRYFCSKGASGDLVCRGQPQEAAPSGRGGSGRGSGEGSRRGQQAGKLMGTVIHILL